MSLNKSYNQFLPWENKIDPSITELGPDDRSGLIYLHDTELQLAAETAIVTQRPLLIRGEPGSGKSSFASFAARNLNWRYYETTITGRTEGKDLLWKFDALARLRDAQASSSNITPNRYITPGVLWWTFNRDDALEFVSPRNELPKNAISISNDPAEPFSKINALRDSSRAVVLIDEIDKADPDVPNDLLEVLGLNRFIVDELDRSIERKIPNPDENSSSPNHFGSLLIVITTNQERDLPPAFIRRCVVHTLKEPQDEKEQIERLVKIAGLHMAPLIESSPTGEELVHKVAEKCCKLRQGKRHYRRGPSTAEFLDALRVCFKLSIHPDSEIWQQVEQNVLIKEGDWKVGRT